MKLYCPQFDSRNVHSIVFFLLSNQSYHKEVILSFLSYLPLS